MKDFLNSLTGSDSGKRLIVLVYHASKSKHTDNQVLFLHLENLKNGRPNDNYIMRANRFNYKDRIQRLVTYKNYIMYNSRPYHSLPVKASGFFDKSDDEVLIDFNEHKINIGSELCGRGRSFIWVTKYDSTSIDIDLANKLGLAGAHEHWVSINLPSSDVGYDLHFPTFIESEHGNNGWFYPNIDHHEKWGRTVHISKINPTCTEASIRGAPEAISKPLIIERGTTAIYLGKVNHDTDYFNAQFKILRAKIDSEFFSESMINHILTEYNNWYGDLSC